METITDADVRRQVLQTLSDVTRTYLACRSSTMSAKPAKVLQTVSEVNGVDVEGIVDTILDRYGRVDIDTIDPTEYWAIVCGYTVAE